jgi:hypothetical protein
LLFFFLFFMHLTGASRPSADDICEMKSCLLSKDGAKRFRKAVPKYLAVLNKRSALPLNAGIHKHIRTDFERWGNSAQLLRL